MHAYSTKRDLYGSSGLFQSLHGMYAPRNVARYYDLLAFRCRWLISKGKDAQAMEVLIKYHANGNERDPLVQVCDPWFIACPTKHTELSPDFLISVRIQRDQGSVDPRKGDLKGYVVPYAICNTRKSTQDESHHWVCVLWTVFRWLRANLRLSRRLALFSQWRRA